MQVVVVETNARPGRTRAFVNGNTFPFVTAHFAVFTVGILVTLGVRNAKAVVWIADLARGTVDTYNIKKERVRHVPWPGTGTSARKLAT